KCFALLENMKIDYIKSKDNISFNKNYFDHPDISLFYFEKTLYVENSVFSYYKNKLKNVNIESVNSIFLKNKENVKLIFPKDTNFVDLGGIISLI
ncbi:DUF6873 family GME fold protein, partial [uncultured Parvimonas sp.]|uniref:DUF6873 family GME fold protein n=2 Tax=uncultured Parvimonas sp. TaxID=747372 RepID=UPI00338F1C9A